MTPIEYLFSLELHGIKLGLENIRNLLRASGDPQRNFPSVHIAGTNGKGSVVALLDSILRAAGYRTGRFTSPHLVQVRERFLVDGAFITPDALNECIEHFREIARKSGNTPTFFELNTAIAFRHFHKARIDVALVEVGLGGRFDSTNIIIPEVAAITNIGLEHTRYLGDTLAKIAFEKAGIIKKRVPVVVGEELPEPLGVIEGRAAELDAPLTRLGRDFAVRLSGGTFDQAVSYTSDGLQIDNARLALPGPYQAQNAAVAIRLAEVLMAKFRVIDEAAIRTGLKSAKWPCRLEKVLESPAVIVDVAHNGAGARELATALRGKAVIVLAIASDKDAGVMIDALAPSAAPLILTEFDGHRALAVNDLRVAAGSHCHEIAPTLEEAVARGMGMASTEKPLVITGSIYTAGQARKLLVERHGALPMEF